MKNRILWGLAGLNVLLVITLAGRFSDDNEAMAQNRRPADYVMIPGEVTGGSSAVVYLIDTSNAMLGAATYDDSSKTIHTMPPIDLSRVFETGAPNTPRTPPVAPGAGAVEPRRAPAR